MPAPSHQRRASTGNQNYMVNHQQQPTLTSGKKSKKENHKMKGEVKALQKALASLATIGTGLKRGANQSSSQKRRKRQGQLIVNHGGPGLSRTKNPLSESQVDFNSCLVASPKWAPGPEFSSPQFYGY